MILLDFIEFSLSGNWLSKFFERIEISEKNETNDFVKELIQKVLRGAHLKRSPSV